MYAIRLSQSCLFKDSMYNLEGCEYRIDVLKPCKVVMHEYTLEIRLKSRNVDISLYTSCQNLFPILWAQNKFMFEIYDS